MLELTNTLKAHGLKVTPQRLSIFKMLRNTHEHPSAEMIYNSLIEEHPTMSLATVYKTLDAFVQHGLIQQINLGEDSYRYDADTTSHIHVQCTECRQVTDIPLLDEVNVLRSKVGAHTGYLLSNERIFFYGICEKCQNAKKECI